MSILGKDRFAIDDLMKDQSCFVSFVELIPYFLPNEINFFIENGVSSLKNSELEVTLLWDVNEANVIEGWHDCVLDKFSLAFELIQPLTVKFMTALIYVF